MHPAFSLLPVLIVLAAAVIVALVFQRLKVSPILGYLVAGALIGQHGFGLFEDKEAAVGLGDLGVVFLLFVIGLELSYARLRVIRKRLFFLGAAQVAVTAFVISAICYFFIGYKGSISVLIGGGLALSSTAMVMQLLVERGEISSRSGRGAFAVLLVQDLAAIPLLALVPIMADQTGEPGSTVNALMSAGMNAVAAIIGIIFVGRFVLRPVYRIVAETRNSELFVALSLFVVLGVGFLTDQAGLSMTLGAFLAGVVLAETQYRHQIEADIEPFRGLLLALFFISVGLTIDLGGIVGNWLPIIGLTVGLLVLKAAILCGLALMVGLPLSSAGHMAILLSQGGEFAFVLFSSAALTGLIPEDAAALLITVVALTMVVTPFLAPLGTYWENRLRDHGSETKSLRDPSDSEELVDHVIITGFGRTGQSVAKILRDAKTPFVAIDLNVDTVSQGRADNMPVFYGDGGRQPVLESAGIERASTLVIAVD
ncbi:MAG: monovalent cation:proton antiporter-2 (CPA2) family protein, partial [Pseudomonadota bacterium]